MKIRALLGARSSARSADREAPSPEGAGCSLAQAGALAWAFARLGSSSGLGAKYNQLQVIAW
jgi:high-affinity Fe2+/Pb2+ permease